jgi:hypothetical protein
MSKKTDMGIYLKTTKTFYYLEYGDNYVSNTLDRIKKALIQRNLIKGLMDSPREQQYEIISFSDAERDDLNMAPIFISKHIQALFQTSTNKKPEGVFK